MTNAVSIVAAHPSIRRRVFLIIRTTSGFCVSGLGIFLIGGGFVNGCATVSGAGISYRLSEGTTTLGFLFILAFNGAVSIGAIALGGRLRYLGKRIRQPKANEILHPDAEFVLLLRSFELDKQHYATEVPDRLQGCLVGPYEQWVRLIVGQPVETPLVEAFRQFYPVIAVGHPKEWLPALGAARLYLDHADWQLRVEELISRAKLIVIVAGSSPGLLWELAAVDRVGALHKTALYVPIDLDRYDASNERWGAFRDALRESNLVPGDETPARLTTDTIVLLGSNEATSRVRIIRPGDGARRAAPGPITVGQVQQPEPSIAEERAAALREMARMVFEMTQLPLSNTHMPPCSS